VANAIKHFPEDGSGSPWFKLVSRIFFHNQMFVGSTGSYPNSHFRNGVMFNTHFL